MTTVRLAYNPGPVDAYGALVGGLSRRSPERGCSIRLAVSSNLVEPFAKGLRPGDVGEAHDGGLAHVPGAQGDNVLLGQRGVERLSDSSRPALLVSYVYLEPFLRNRHRYAYRDWVLDSGAFSAHASGTTIDHAAYLEKCRELLASDPTLTEVFALDVIGDWRASARNAEAAWEAGVPAVPCYHVGDPESELSRLAREYPKVALGGAVGYRGKDAWAAQCFARVWPKRIHGFGFGSERSILALPWHSVDATNWELGPCRYGNWKTFGRMSVRGSKQNLRAEVEWYLDLERRARAKWKKQMAQLEGSERERERESVRDLPSDSPSRPAAGRTPSAVPSPTVRLAVDAAAAGGRRADSALEGERR